MKKRHIMLCATIMIMTMLTACSSKEKAVSSNDVEEEGTNTAEDASDQRAKISNQDDWLVGTIQNETVHIKLQIEDNTIDCIYYTDEHQNKKTLKGVKHNDVFLLYDDAAYVGDLAAQPRMEGIIVTDNLIEGIWNQGKDSYPVYFTKPGVSQEVAIKPSAQLEKWRGDWVGAQTTIHAGSQLSITPLFDNLIRFRIHTFSGIQSSGFTSLATVKDGKAVYLGEDDVTFSFTYEDDKIKCETADYAYKCGAGIRYDASYIRKPMSGNQPTAKALGICYTDDQEAVFKDLVGPYYNQFIEYAQHYTEGDDKDNLGMDVRVFGMKGYSNTAIVMVNQDTNDMMAALDGGEGIYYFCNMKHDQFARNTPLTFKTFIGDREVIHKTIKKVEKKVSQDITYDFRFDIDQTDYSIKAFSVYKNEKGVEKKLFAYNTKRERHEMFLSEDITLENCIITEDKDNDGFEEVEIFYNDVLGYPSYMVLMKQQGRYDVAFDGVDFDTLEYVDVNHDGILEIINAHGGGGGYVSTWTGLDLVNERKDGRYSFSYDLTQRYYEHKKSEALAAFEASSTSKNFVNLLNLMADLGLAEACKNLIEDNRDLVKNVNMEYSKSYDAPADTFLDYLLVRAKDYQQTWEELKNTDESTHLNETIVPQEIIDHMHVIDDQHHIAYYEEVDMDGDGQLESIVATGQLDKDPYESDISHIYIVRLKDDNIQQLSDNLASGGYGVYDIRTVKLQHTPNKTYLYCRLSNGANLGGFNLYGLDKEDVEIVLHCSSSVGSGVDKLVDSDEDGLYDGYEKIRSSYDVLYYEITYAYALENEEFMLSGMSINLPPYPDTIKDILVQYLSLRLLDIGQSPELSSRLNELCTDQQANTIEIPYNYLHSALLNTILGLDEAIQFTINEETGDATATCVSEQKETITYSFHLMKDKGRWRIDAINLEGSKEPINDSF